MPVVVPPPPAPIFVPPQPAYPYWLHNDGSSEPLTGWEAVALWGLLGFTGLACIAILGWLLWDLWRF